jgi:hypothetical protein
MKTAIGARVWTVIAVHIDFIKCPGGASGRIISLSFTMFFHFLRAAAAMLQAAAARWAELLALALCKPARPLDGRPNH